MLLRRQSERVHVDAHRGDVGVVLEGLHQVEVVAVAHLEAVVAVQLEKRGHDGVVARHALHTGHRVTRLQHRAVPPIGEVERLLALPGVHHRVVARHERVALHNPDELLTGVVEVQLQLVGRGRDRLTTRELQGLNQVLVRHLGELATLVRVQIDVLNIQRGGLEIRGVDTVANRVLVGQRGRDVPAQVLQLLKLQVNAHLVVLQRNQRQRQTRVTIEPELEGNVHRVARRAVEDLRRGAGLSGRAVRVAGLATLHQQVGQLRNVAHHLGIARLLARLLRELIPDMEPVAIMFVNALATNLHLHTGDEIVTQPVEPAELRTRAVSRPQGHLRQRHLQVNARNQITVTLDRARHTLAEARRAVKRVLNGLHGKVGVAAIHLLEKRNLRITRQVNILGTISDKLH